jgi:hypothetical protein
LKQGEGKTKRWRAYKVETIFEETKAKAKGQWPLSHTHTLWYALKPNFAQATMKGGAGGGGGKRRIQKEHGPKGPNPKIKHLHPKKKVLFKAPPNLKIKIIKIKP